MVFDLRNILNCYVASCRRFSIFLYPNFTEDLDMSNLSLHQAKRLEMEAQVRILELEQALETERLRLAALRRYHYQLDGENEA